MLDDVAGSACSRRVTFTWKYRKPFQGSKIFRFHWFHDVSSFHMWIFEGLKRISPQPELSISRLPCPCKTIFKDGRAGRLLLRGPLVAQEGRKTDLQWGWFHATSFHLNLSYFRHTNTKPRTFFNRIGSWTLNQFLAFLGKCASRKTKTHKTQKCIGPRSISTFHMFVPFRYHFLKLKLENKLKKIWNFSSPNKQRFMVFWPTS